MTMIHLKQIHEKDRSITSKKLHENRHPYVLYEKQKEERRVL